jgi:flagellar biosynthesis/type III secretory pathway M-ring protein FliF/YscJ
VKEVQKEDTRNNGQPDENLGLIIAISSLAVFLALAIVVGLVFAIRRIRRKSRRGRVNGNDDGEDVPLRDLARNEQRNEANDANEQLPHEPNRADERALEANDMEQRLQEQNNEEERDGGEQHLQAVQETQDPTPPFQATPSTRNICG